MVTKRTFRSIKEDETSVWRKLYNERLQTVSYSLSYTIPRATNSRRIRQVERTVLMGKNGMDMYQSNTKKERDHLEGTGADGRYRAYEEIRYERII
jgi:hypothetical protein